MDKNSEIVISKELFQIISPILMIARFVGICPITYEKSGNNYVTLKWSRKFCAYGYLLVISLSTLAICGMIHDLKVERKYSIRMKGNKGKYITICDISDIILTVLFGVVSTPFTFNKFWVILESFNKIDSILELKNVIKTRKFSLMSIIAPVLLFIITAIFDIYNYNKRSSEQNSVFYNYLPFYILYFIALVQELYYFHLVYFISTRLKSLHSKLERHFSKYSDIDGSNKEKWVSNLDMSNTIKSNNANVSKENNKNCGNEKHIAVLKVGDIQMLTKVHDEICNSVQAVNYCCGFVVLLTILSCLLHLIVTPYFLLLELTSSGSYFYFYLQTSWVIFHLMRLLIIIEPCNRCIILNQQVTVLVCKLLARDTQINVKQQLGVFALQLSFCKLEFTSCDLFKVDRSLLTAIVGAVTTYLVILFQFND